MSDCKLLPANQEQLYLDEILYGNSFIYKCKCGAFHRFDPMSVPNPASKMTKQEIEKPKHISACNCSGEGMRDGTICMVCKGKGSV